MDIKSKSTKTVYTKIFEDNWELFKAMYPSYADEYYDNVVKKMIECGDPSFGYIEYGCMSMLTAFL